MKAFEILRKMASLMPFLDSLHLSFKQAMLLMQIPAISGRELTMTNVSRMMGISTAAGTGMVDRLETLGHTFRFHSEQDRRKVMVCLTEKGATLTKEIKNILEKEEEESVLAS